MLKYQGKGFIPGIPTRDLTDQEAHQFGEARLVASGLYKREHVQFEAKPERRVRADKKSEENN